MFDEKAVSRFWAKVIKTDNCWEWQAGTTIDGYGKFYTAKKTYHAHRFSWELSFGEIKNGLYACHHCDNRLCVNPHHLFLGTQLDNMRDKMKKGRHVVGRTAKINMEIADKIRVDYASGHYTQLELEKLYNIDQTVISGIILNKAWKK